MPKKEEKHTSRHRRKEVEPRERAPQERETQANRRERHSLTTYRERDRLTAPTAIAKTKPDDKHITKKKRMRSTFTKNPIVITYRMTSTLHCKHTHYYSTNNLNRPIATLTHVHRREEPGAGQVDCRNFRRDETKPGRKRREQQKEKEEEKKGTPKNTDY